MILTCVRMRRARSRQLSLRHDSANETSSHANGLWVAQLLEVFEILTSKVCQTDLVLGMRSGFVIRSVHARLYKSLCAALTICSTLVNIHTDVHTHIHTRTHTHTQTTFDQLIWKDQPAELKLNETRNQWRNRWASDKQQQPQTFFVSRRLFFSAVFRGSVHNTFKRSIRQRECQNADCKQWCPIMWSFCVSFYARRRPTAAPYALVAVIITSHAAFDWGLNSPLI